MPVVVCFNNNGIVHYHKKLLKKSSCLLHHLYACLLCLKISNVDFMLPLLKQSLELNCVRANSICYLVLIKFWKNWAEKGACSVVVMATKVFQNFSCPLYCLNFGVGILSNILQIKVIFHKRKQHVHHSSKYLFRHAHEVCKAWEHGTEGSQHIKSSRGKGEFPFSTPSLCLWIFISSSPVRLRDYQLAQSCF